MGKFVKYECTVQCTSAHRSSESLLEKKIYLGILVHTKGMCLLRVRLDCLTKPNDIMHMIVFSLKYQSMILSAVYTVCLISLLWETKIFHTKLENNIEKKLRLL